MQHPPHPIPHRPLPWLAGGLVGSAVLGQVLPGWACAGLAVAGAASLLGWSLRTGDPRLRLWIGCFWGLLALQALRAVPEDKGPLALGTYRSHWQGRGQEVGELQGHGIPVQLPQGFARDGDRVEIHESARRIQYAAPPGGGPEPFAWSADPGQVRRTRAGGDSPWKTPAWILHLREWLARRMENLEGESSRGLARALLLGQSDAVDPELKDRFTRTGTRHLLALSGLHVGLLWWLWLRPLCGILARLANVRFGRFGVPHEKRGLVAVGLQVLALLVLLPILGSGTPALRAVMALALADCARQVRSAPGAPAGAGRRPDPLSIWSLALVVEMLCHPREVLSVSLQLSYAATLGLILFWAPVQRAAMGAWQRLGP
ncbi:MAG: ComEC/Rec2 family competence protein, partial [Planctomycetes bacterium]|nr:ComEC/Rec2 family competence protein [Planctomycetota bacterium]